MPSLIIHKHKTRNIVWSQKNIANQISQWCYARYPMRKVNIFFKSLASELVRAIKFLNDLMTPAAQNQAFSSGSFMFFVQ